MKKKGEKIFQNICLYILHLARNRTRISEPLKFKIKYRQSFDSFSKNKEEKKKQSWSSYVSGNNTSTRQVTSGTSSFHAIAQHKSLTLFDPQDIAKLLAPHISSISANSNYDDHFLTVKSQTDSFPVSRDADDFSLSYNLSTPLLEHLSSNSKNLINYAPGPDNIHTSVLKNLHPNLHAYPLSLYNSFFLLDWKLASILDLESNLSKPSIILTRTITDNLLPSFHSPNPKTHQRLLPPHIVSTYCTKLCSDQVNWKNSKFVSNNILFHSRYGFWNGPNTLQALED